MLACKDLATVIAINNAVELAPWADIVLGGDLKWWRRNKGLPVFQGFKYTCHSAVPKVYPDVLRLIPTGIEGFEWEPGRVRTGWNSGYVAPQLAAQMGASKILLLGYDMQPSPSGEDHWHAPHPDGTHPGYARCLPLFASLVQPLADHGIQIVNCSPGSALRVFPCQPLNEALACSTP